MRNYKIPLAFIFGVLFVLLIFYVLGKIPKFSQVKETNDYYILTNQISKMNKMVVLEQDFSTLQKTNLGYEILGNKVSDNEIVTLTKTNAQVSYDLNQMKMEVDSVNKKLIIRELPQADIRITPSVEIKSMDDSFFNRIDENQIKKVTQTSKDKAVKSVNQKKLIAEGKVQLMENLNQIMVLAKALNYEMVDQTGTLNLKL